MQNAKCKVQNCAQFEHKRGKFCPPVLCGFAHTTFPALLEREGGGEAVGRGKPLLFHLNVSMMLLFVYRSSRSGSNSSTASGPPPLKGEARKNYPEQSHIKLADRIFLLPSTYPAMRIVTKQNHGTAPVVLYHSSYAS